MIALACNVCGEQLEEHKAKSDKEGALFCASCWEYEQELTFVVYVSMKIKGGLYGALKQGGKITNVIDSKFETSCNIGAILDSDSNSIYEG
jgi:hypothetical protein